MIVLRSSVDFVIFVTCSLSLQSLSVGRRISQCQKHENLSREHDGEANYLCRRVHALSVVVCGLCVVFSGSLVFGGSLVVGGSLVFGGSLVVGGSLVFGGSLVVGGSLVFGGSVFFGGSSFGGFGLPLSPGFPPPFGTPLGTLKPFGST